MNRKNSFLFVIALTSLVAVSCAPTQSSSNSEVSSAFVSLFTKKAATVYVETDAGVETDDTILYFTEADGNIPFLNLSNSLAILQRSLSDSSLTTNGHQVMIGRDENEGKITLDFDAKTVHYNDLDLYAANHGKLSVLNLVSDTKDANGNERYLQSQTSEHHDTIIHGKPVTIDLSHYNIPMYFEEGAGYIPVQTFADLLLSERNIMLGYNGVNLYMTGASAFPTEMMTTYYDVPTGKRSEKMAKFSRDELALAMDFQYGLKDEHGIDNFDDYFKDTDLNDSLLSTDPVVADKAVCELAKRYLSDFHSSFNAASPYAGAAATETIKNDATLLGPAYSEYQLIRYSYEATRKAVFQSLSSGKKSLPDAYEVYGDTAYVTFNHFTMPTQDYYATAPTKDATDTYGIIEYAHSQLMADSSIKNVVLDLSCNSGGSINAAMYVAGWLLPYSIINVENSLTGERGSFTYRSDVDLDGQFTTADQLKGKKVYCLVSPASYSATNFLSSTLWDSDQVRLIGRHTSGGACIVQHLTCADGTIWQTSGNRCLCTNKNGSYYKIDQGVDVNFSLDSVSDFFNRPVLTAKIDSLI